MLWIFLSILVAITMSISVFIDNYVTDVCFKGRLPQAQKFFGVPAYLLTCIITALIFPIASVEIHNALILIAAGVLSSIGSIWYYKALTTEDSTGATIFLQLAPVIYLVVGWTLLQQHISPLQILAFCLILSAPLVVIFATPKRSKKLRLRAALLIFLYLLFAVSSNLIFVGLSSDGQSGAVTHFPTAFFYVILGKFLTDLTLMIIFRSWRKRLKLAIKTSKHKLVLPMALNEIFFIMTEIAYRLALIIAPVALVSVLTNSLQLIITFLLGIILTLIWPIFGRERLRPRIIVAHSIAIILAIAGIILELL